jgi:type II secretory pathway pseudopilin PulG
MKNINFLKKNSSKKGFALTEVLMAIAVIIIIGIAAYPLYRNARVSSQVEGTANDLALLQTNVQTLYSGQPNYTGLTPSQIETAGLAPDDIKTGTVGTWDDTWGGLIFVAPLAATEGNYQANSLFTVSLANVPTGACTQLVNRVAPAFALIGTGTSTDGTNGGLVKGNNGTTTENVVDVTNLATLCDGGTVGSGVASIIALSSN